MPGKTINKMWVGFFIVLSVFFFSACKDGRIFGGYRNDGANDIRQTLDGGYIVAGYTRSFGAGGTDFWVLKLDGNGKEVWQKTYGTESYETADSVQQTMDGGYIIVGRTQSPTYGAKYWDFMILKIDAQGTEEWMKIFGGDGFEKALSVQQTQDGGYVIGGVTTSVQGTATPFGEGEKENTDCLILKIDANGEYQWHQVYDGGNGDAVQAVLQTGDGGYIAAGYSKPLNGSYDFLVLKLRDDSYSGEIEWSRTYGGSQTEMAKSIKKTSDGGYIVAGDRASDTGNDTDFWVVRIDSGGELIWSESYGGSGFERANSIDLTSNGGYIVAGYTTSYGAGRNDFWIVKIDAAGTAEWAKTCGSPDYDVANSIHTTLDGGYIIAGNTAVSESNGLDFWIVKLTADGKLPAEWQSPFTQILNLFPQQ